MNSTFVSQFKKPGSTYRGAPFWAWNGKLDPQELRKQIRIMQRMGLGGFFMHSRVGLDTAYLGKEWMDCVNACVDEAEKLDMQAWLYDEDRWPSGAAGGLVTKNPKYRLRYLVMKIYDRPSELQWTDDVKAAYTAKLDGFSASEVERIAQGKTPSSLGRGRKIIAFCERTAHTSSWYNGYTYLDTMNPQAVEEFIKVTHEAYRKKFGKEFSKRIPGIFTDEPNHSFHLELNYDGQYVLCVPWTGRLLKVFRQRYGYDLLDHIPEVFLMVDGQKISKARLHYHDCTTQLFVDAFSKQIGQWCDKHGLQFTGHVLSEPTLSSQTNVVGSCMRFYEYMQAPGMDLLTEHNREYDTARQVTSMARQFGRKWRLTETYGCTGWDFNFAGHKALGDWQAALGINLRAQHLSWYTMSGQAKRDYPAGIFFQSPWWEHYSKVEDYFARIHVAMSRGKEVRDVLVLHPVESMWMIYARDLQAEKQKMDKQLWQLRDALLAANLDFDYGDEEVMSRHAKVSRGQGGPKLQVGQADYRVVVVPPMLTMRRSTLELIKQFKDAGGEVVFAGPAAGLVDGDVSDEVKAFAKTCVKVPAKGQKFADAVAVAGRRVSITDGKGNEIPSTLYCLREDRDAWYLFIANTSHDHFGRKVDDSRVCDRIFAYDDVTVSLAAETKTQPVELNLDTGEVMQTDCRHEEGGWSIQTGFPVIGSRLFAFAKKSGGFKALKPMGGKTISNRAIVGEKWSVQLSEPNVVVLDQPRYRIGDGRWQKTAEILQIDRKVRDVLGLPHRGGRMAQPWTREKIKNPRTVDVELQYTFDVKVLPSGPLLLALECPQTFDVTINGRSVDVDTASGWWVDPSLQTLRIDPADLCVGTNTLEIVCHYNEMHPGLEMVYLLGQFGVKVKKDRATMVAAVTELKLGDWTKQGLPFYSGNVCYTRKIKPRLGKGERLVVQVPSFSGTAVRVLIDGQEAGVIAWPPNELDITQWVSDGKAVNLGLEVLGHRRNSHGPMHLNERWPRWTGPDQYVTEGTQVEDYTIVPCGLTAAPRLVVCK